MGEIIDVYGYDVRMSQALRVALPVPLIKRARSRKSRDSFEHIPFVGFRNDPLIKRKLPEVNVHAYACTDNCVFARAAIINFTQFWNVRLSSEVVAIV